MKIALAENMERLLWIRQCGIVTSKDMAYKFGIDRGSAGCWLSRMASIGVLKCDASRQLHEYSLGKVQL